MNVMRWLERLTYRERRRAARSQAPRLIAHYWDGAAPAGHGIRDISSTGLYLLTEQRWYPGTVVTMSLQRAGAPDPERTVRVDGKVVRCGSDGVGFDFVMLEKNDQSHTSESGTVFKAADRKTFRRFLNHLHSDSGQSLVEYILMLPFLILLIINLVNFSGFFYAWITVANAARAGADYAVLGGASVGAPGQPTAANVASVIAEDVYSLPNKASVQVNICQNDQGTVTTLSGTCTGTVADPETEFVLLTVDVTYTYQPLLPAGFKFPNLNIYATLPPTTIHRRAVMRVLQ
jgi:Flp pilus assembly protein TadG